MPLARCADGSLLDFTLTLAQAHLCEARGLDVAVEAEGPGFVVRRRDGAVMARGRRLEDVLGREIYVLEDEG